MKEHHFQTFYWCIIAGRSVISRDIRVGRIREYAAVLVMMCGLTLTGCANKEGIMPAESASSEIRNVEVEGGVSDLSEIVDAEAEGGVSDLSEIVDAEAEGGVSDLSEIVDAEVEGGVSDLSEIVHAEVEDGVSDPAEITDSYVTDEVAPMVMIGGKIYYATGEESTIQYRCGMMDGEITSTMGSQEIPVENNQSNFGSGYGYQYGPEGTIEVQMDGKWYVYIEENNY